MSKVFQCISAMFDNTKPSTCDLWKICKSPYMAMSGDLDSEILIIGEAPGAEEDACGSPFVGDSGKLLRHALALAGVTKFAMNNSVRCRPPGNRDPKTIELRSCRAFIDADIDQLPNLKLVVLIGNHAMQTILGHKGVLEHSGTYKSLTIGSRTFGILCVMHPSYILQNPDELNNFNNHIGRIPNALTGSLVDSSDEGVYYTITTIAEWEDLVHKLMEARQFVYDLETNSLDPYPKTSEITLISFSISPREAYGILINPYMKDVIYRDLKWIMESSAIAKIGHNIKFDNLWLKVKWDIDVRGTIWDTSIAQYLLDENESHGLKSMAWKYTKCGGYEDRLVQGQPHMHVGANLAKYGCMDSDITNRIFEIQKPLLAKDVGLMNINKNLLLPVIDVLMEMERRGIRVDPVKLASCSSKVDAFLQTLGEDIKKSKSVAKFENTERMDFNPRSPLQLRKILFEYEKLDPIKFTEKTKSPSTDRSVLEFYKDHNKLCGMLSDHSLYSSMKSKMIAELNEYTIDGRIHTHYWVTQTSTGRTSSDDPNLQNVTKGKKDVVGIREVFLADDRYDLLEVDYNQHELRCMAELAEDEELYNAVRTGDAHTSTAATILQKDPSLVTEDDRRDIGKTFNFGFIYGLTKYGIMKRLNCTEAVADAYLNRFFGVYHKTKLYMDATALFVKENGYVKSRTGRYRRFPIWTEGDGLGDKSIREAINMPVQALAGDILLYSLIGIHNMLKAENATSYLCLEIHDSLMLNLHKREHYLIPKIKEIMLTYFRKYIPFKYELAVDMKIGPNWGQMEKLNV